MQKCQNELQKEFEPERMIFFSDAVFAIAITLLILEVRFRKLPDNPTPQELRSILIRL